MYLENKRLFEVTKKNVEAFFAKYGFAVSKEQIAEHNFLLQFKKRNYAIEIGFSDYPTAYPWQLSVNLVINGSRKLPCWKLKQTKFNNSDNEYLLDFYINPEKSLNILLNEFQVYAVDFLDGSFNEEEYAKISQR